MIINPLLKIRYKKGNNSFIRDRKLTFSNTLIFILRKSVKSLQNSLNEFFNQLDNNLTKITSSAFSQARQKLSHKVFIELNRIGIIEEFYKSFYEYKTYKGLRLLGIDGSKIYLPDSLNIESEFGRVKIENYTGKNVEYSGALISVMYDVLNNLVIDSKIAPLYCYEGDLAAEHLKYCIKNDLIIGDRGYTSYKLLAKMHKTGVNFLFRCSTSSFKESQSMFSGDKDSKIVILRKNRSYSDLELPDEITVRFVKVILDTGEIEVLVTSLLDENYYQTNDFKELYWKRWGIETFYNIIKNRLDIENFTGKTVEAVKQDFYSTIFISNYESVLSEDAEEKLQEKSNDLKNEVKVNKSISFNALKNNVINLFLSDSDDIDDLLNKMTELFMQNPTAIKKNRSYERIKSTTRSLNFYKYRKKICF
jgi:hypothetical protein